MYKSNIQSTLYIHINMKKYNLLFTLWICFTVIQSQITPPPPLVVQIRMESMESLFDNFKKIFCTSCTTEICNQNFYNLYLLPETGHFSETNITNNPDNITRCAFYQKWVNGTYIFPKAKLENIKMGFVMYLPFTKKLKGLVLYNHPTLFGKLEIPANSQQTPAITALYVSSGYGILYPNYLGYQSGDYYPHPYVIYPFTNILSAILALNEAVKSIKQHSPITRSLNLFAVGYSEGAAYSVLMEKCIEDPESCQGQQLSQFYQYQGAVGLDGPYDLGQVIKPFLVNKVSKHVNNTYEIQTQLMTNFGKPSLLALTIMSYMHFSLGTEDYYSKMNTNFWKMQCLGLDKNLCKVQGTQFPDILFAMQSQKLSLQIAKSIAHSGFGRDYMGQGERYLWPVQAEYLYSDHNSVLGLASKELMDSALFNVTLKQAAAINRAPTKPVFLFSLRRDSIVSVLNTEYYVKRYNKTKVYYFENSQHKVCPKKDQVLNVDHAGGQLVANVFALSFIKNITASLTKQGSY